MDKTRHDAHDEMRNRIMNTAVQYRDERGNVDLKKMRSDHPRIYSRIPYYFNDVDNFLVQMENFEGEHKKVWESTPEAGTTIGRQIIRNKLAYEHLKYLRHEKNLTLDDIGQLYGVSKMYISKLYRELDKVFGAEAEQAAALQA
jgi:YesN/AraC family two-component response regulator